VQADCAPVKNHERAVEPHPVVGFRASDPGIITHIAGCFCLLHTAHFSCLKKTFWFYYSRSTPSLPVPEAVEAPIIAAHQAEN